MGHKLVAATYNVHEWVGKDGRQRPARAVRVIGDLGADVVALQEVSFCPTGPGRYTMEDLARHTHMQVIPGLTLTKKDADFGNVLLTRHPLRDLRKLDLTFKTREPRGALMAVLDVHNVPCTVIATHLGLQRRERHLQVQGLIKEIKAHGAGPLVLMGDFNEWNTFSGALRILKAHFGKGPTPPTYPARCPVLGLDRIMVEPIKALQKVLVLKTPLTRFASDHLPVKAFIRLS